MRKDHFMMSFRITLCLYTILKILFMMFNKVTQTLSMVHTNSFKLCPAENTFPSADRRTQRASLALLTQMKAADRSSIISKESAFLKTLQCYLLHLKRSICAIQTIPCFRRIQVDIVYTGMVCKDYIFQVSS